MRVEKVSSTKAVVTPSGRIDISNSQDLKQGLLELYDEGVREIVLDFSKVSGIDSSGLGKLLLFQKKLTERRGSIKIVNITNEHVRKLFTMIHLDKVINIE